jgi:hypothetical protein
MAAHIRDLAADHGIRIVLGAVEGHWSADTRKRLVEIGPVVDLVGYCSALHEIGHIVGRGRSAPKVEAEANAWVYAIETAQWPLDDAVRNEIETALRSYWPWGELTDEDWAEIEAERGRHEYRSPRPPARDYPFWQSAPLREVHHQPVRQPGWRRDLGK